MCMEKNMAEVAEYLKEKKGFDAIVAAEKTGDKFDFGSAGKREDLIILTKDLLKNISADLKVESSLPKSANSLQSQAMTLNTDQNAEATIVANIVGDQVNYGYAGNAQAQEIAQMIMQIIHIFNKKV